MIVVERSVMAMSFGAAVRQRRMELGLTQEELGARIGYDSTRVSKVEVGHTYRRLPDADEFRKWTDALEIDPVILLRQMGYAGEDRPRSSQPIELVFAQLADEIRSAENMPAEVQDTMLDGLRMARRMYEVKTGGISKS
jgi:transcriptional regulator with XRE-family HTH domain